VLCANEPELAKLRASVREFLDADRDKFGWQPTVDSWLACWDEAFGARLGDAGFLGRLDRLGDRITMLAPGLAERAPNQVDDAGLHDGVGEDRVD
jgi:hypothetical protein